MILSDFSPMIELAVTLNIAFVAVEYVKSYTNAICNQLFNFAQYLKESFEECKSLLVDDITLNSIHDSKINGNSISGEIEKAKIAKEKLSKEMGVELHNFALKIEKVCQAKSISSVSLWLFLYGLTYLFCMGIDSLVAESNIKIFSVWLTIFTFIYTLFGWSIGEKGYKKCCLDFTSLRHGLVSYVIALIFATLLTVLGFYFSFMLECFTTIFIFSVLYMYSNFVVSSIMIWKRASKVKREIRDIANGFKSRCNQLKRDVDKLLAVNELEFKIESNNIAVLMAKTANNNQSQISISKKRNRNPRRFKGKQ